MSGRPERSGSHSNRGCLSPRLEPDTGQQRCAAPRQRRERMHIQIMNRVDSGQASTSLSRCSTRTGFTLSVLVTTDSLRAL